MKLSDFLSRQKHDNTNPHNTLCMQCACTNVKVIDQTNKLLGER